jgi:type IV secretory pathway TraG/TraD family ATPase VirD4
VVSNYAERYILHEAVPVEEFCRACNAALRSLQWQETFIDRDACTIVAQQKHEQPLMGKQWSYKLGASIYFEQHGAEVLAFAIKITESNYGWSAQHCRQQLEKLLEAVDGAIKRATVGATARGARWASVDEIESQGYVGALSAGQFVVCRLPDGRFMRLPAADTNRHALVCGPTGSGKTTGIFIPNLIERTDCSALVTEATGGKGMGDLYEKTSGWRRSQGHNVFYFNPDAPRSHRLNPLDSVNSYRQARRICEIIMQSTTLRTHRGDQSWELAERMLLTGLILHATGERRNERCHLGYVNEILNNGIGGVQKVIASTEIAQADMCFTRFLKSTTEGYRNLVLNGVMNRLDAWNTPQVAAATQYTDVHWQELLSQLWTIYLAVPAAKQELKPLMALVFNDLIEFIMGHQFVHPPMLMLDEFTNFGYVAGLPEKLTIIRHDNVPAVLGVQDYIQLELKYDREAKLLISQPGTRIFFKPNDLETAKNISAMLGEAINETTKLGSNGQLNDKEKKEPLLTPDSLLNLGTIDDTGRVSMIVMTPGTRPVLVPAFHWSDYTARTDRTVYPPAPVPELNALNTLTYLHGDPRVDGEAYFDDDEGDDRTKHPDDGREQGPETERYKEW